jgi:hypothetical protein
MNKINTFTLEGFDVDVLYQNGYLAYSFEFDGKPYGQKIKLESKSVVDISTVTFLLLENALATHKKLNENNRLRKGAKSSKSRLSDNTKSE